MFADLDSPAELGPRETVCDACHLAHNSCLPACPTCAEAPARA